MSKQASCGLAAELHHCSQRKSKLQAGKEEGQSQSCWFHNAMLLQLILTDTPTRPART